MFPHVRADLADHAQVEEEDAFAGRLPHQVAWVRVGVEEAVDEDLLVEGLEQLLGRSLRAVPWGASVIGPPCTSSMTSSRDVE